MNEPADNKHTMKKSLLFVGLDVHAQYITSPLALAGEAEARLYGSIPNDLHALEVFAKLRKAHPGVELRVGLRQAVSLRSIPRSGCVSKPQLRHEGKLGEYCRRMKGRLGSRQHEQSRRHCRRGP